MLIEKKNKTNKCSMYYVKLYDEKGKRRLYPHGHKSKKLAKEYEHKLKNEVSEKKMFPEKCLQRKFKDFVPEYLKKHASKKSSYRDYVSITKKLIVFFGVQSKSV